MKTVLKILLSCLLLGIAYLAFWPITVDPKSWTPSADPGYTGDYLQNDKLAAATYFDLPAGEYGPEDVAIGEDGFIYTAVHSGKILRIDPDSGAATVFAQVNGRPLGIEFAADGVLWVADAYHGLVRIGENGEVDLVASETDDGSPILYADDVDIAADGRVYFSDASTRFGAKQSGDTLAASLLDLMEHSANGRILVYDPVSGSTRVFADGLTFANGVAVTDSGDALLVNETGTYSVHRYSLADSDYGRRNTLISDLPGFPDNINRMADGSFWVGIVSPRSKAMDDLAGSPAARRLVMRLPEFARPGPLRYSFVLRIDEEGKVLANLQDPAGTYANTTGATDLPDGRLVLSSLTEPKLALLGLD
ncbi:MAG: SMP-30/gluconolactonase/LRE family protein [Pseudomonadota bacterium]